MISSLDPYSEFLDKETLKSVYESTEGEFVGIGIVINIEDGVLKIISPILGSPAAKAGVMAGDKILKIGNKSAKGITLGQAIKLLRGKKNTKVILTVEHENTKEKENFTIIRDTIQIPSIENVKILNKKAGIGYIQLTRFNTHTGSELSANIKELLKKNMKALIIDLRFNPGGLLDASIDVVNSFVSEGIIVYTKGRTQKSHKVYRASKEKTFTKLPLVILVNKQSASASEIVAGALKDHSRATIIGARTYGKGLVQRIIVLKDERTALKLTVARYYTPSGTIIQKSEKNRGGIIPDIEVNLNKKEQEELMRRFYNLKQYEKMDKQLQKAVDFLKKL